MQSLQYFISHEEIEEIKAEARKNFKAGFDEIEKWHHPIYQEECRIINEEADLSAKNAMNGLIDRFTLILSTLEDAHGGLPWVRLSQSMREDIQREINIIEKKIRRMLDRLPD